MNRTDFQRLADAFIEESQTLLKDGKPGGAYYLAGYAVECALKSCIAKLTAEHDFPRDRKFVESCYSHDLEKLLRVSGLSKEFELAGPTGSNLESNWLIVKDWDESSRYVRKDQKDAEALIKAISETTHGILPWFKAHW